MQLVSSRGNKYAASIIRKIFPLQRGATAITWLVRIIRIHYRSSVACRNTSTLNLQFEQAFNSNVPAQSADTIYFQCRRRTSGIDAYSISSMNKELIWGSARKHCNSTIIPYKGRIIIGSGIYSSCKAIISTNHITISSWYNRINCSIINFIVLSSSDR